jgi:hypothetical protein
LWPIGNRKRIAASNRTVVLLETKSLLFEIEENAMKSKLTIALLCSLSPIGAAVLSGCGSSTASTDKMETVDGTGDAKMGGSMMATEKMSGEKMGMEKMGTDKMGGEKMGMEAPMNNAMEPMKMGGGKMGGDKMGSDKMGNK